MEPSLSIVFGPERATYLRMLYGTQSSPFGGLTPGRFWDMRGLPIPYTPRTGTAMQFATDAGLYDGQIATLSVVATSSVDASSKTSVVITAPITTFSVQLGKGLNTISIAVGKKVLASISVTATVFASYVYAMATQIYSGTWERSNALEADIFSDAPTVLTNPIIGFDDLFHPAVNINAAARGLVVNALMNFPGSTQAVQSLGQAVLHQTPIFERKTPDFKKAWLRGITTQAWEVSGKTMHVWAPNKASARYPTSIAAASSFKSLGPTTRTVVTLDQKEHDFRFLTQPQAPDAPVRRRWISMAASSDTTDLEFFAHNRYHGVVAAPGLWDNPGSTLDTGTPLDSGRTMDASGDSLDPKNDGHVGMPLFPSRPYVYDPVLPVAALDKEADSIGIPLDPYLESISSDETVTWAQQKQSTAAAGPVFRTAYTFTPVYSSGTGTQNPGLLLVFTAGWTEPAHAHSVVILSDAIHKSVRSGTPYSGTTEFPDTGTKHQHSFTLSWSDGYYVDTTSNHGHIVTIQEF